MSTPVLVNPDGTSTARIVDGILDHATAITETLTTGIGLITNSRDAIRDTFLTAERIQPLPAYTGSDYSICAIDGAMVVEPLYSIDMLATVAVTADGLAGTRTAPTLNRTWADALVRDTANRTIATLHMFTDEAGLLLASEHDTRLIDGTHFQTFIEFTKAFNSKGIPAATATALLTAISWEHLLTTLTTPGNGVASLAKAEQSTDLMTELRRAFPALEAMPTLTDKALAALVLEPGEILTPKPVSHRPNWLDSNIDGPTTPAFTAFTHALAGIREAIRDGRIHNAFIKPHTSTGTVRVQYATPDRAATHTDPATAQLLARIAAEVVGPDIQEPFPQYIADIEAKSVAIGLNALKQSVTTTLADTHPDLAPLLIRGYRT